MSLLDKIAGSKKFLVKGSSTGYTGAKKSDLTADWFAANKTADEILKMQLRDLRGRSRDLARNNDYVRKFLRLLSVNVVGPQGVRTQSRIKDENDKLDIKTNKTIEGAFRRWGKKGTASVCGRKSWIDIQNLFIKGVARDGEALLYEVQGGNVNAFGYALQVLEPDLLNEDYNRELSNGNVIKMGIEFAPSGRAVAYHLLTKHPGDTSYAWAGQKYRVIPSERIIHGYIEEEGTQSRGIPWTHTAIIRLRMLGGYEEAALVCARVGASKMGIYTQQEGASQYAGDDKDSDGNPITEVEPGMVDVAPKGYTFNTFDPTYPHAQFEPFVKAVLRGAAAGMGPSYNALANDLEGVNYSSLRQGALEERDMYRCIQKWFTETLLERVYKNWLDMSLLTGELPYSYLERDRLHAPKFQARGWDWVDPLKEVKADREAVEALLTSRQRVLAKRGDDFEDVIDELVYEKEYAEAHGIELVSTGEITDNDLKDDKEDK